MKRVLLISTFLISVLSLIALAPKETHKYVVKDAGIKAKFPGAYEIAEKTNEETKTISATCELKINEAVYVFLISHTVHQIQLDDPATFTAISVDSFMKSMGANIVSQSPWMMKKNEGKKATFKSSENGVIGEYRAIIIGQIQYQVAAVTSGNSLDIEMIQNFFKSVKIKG